MLPPAMAMSHALTPDIGVLIVQNNMKLLPREMCTGVQCAKSVKNKKRTILSIRPHPGPPTTTTQPVPNSRTLYKASSTNA